MLVTTSLIVGGAESQVYLLACHFASLGHDVLVVPLLEPSAYVEDLAARGIETVRIGVEGPGSVPAAVARLKRLIADWKPTVVHAHMFHAILLARLARLAGSRAPLVSTTHNLAPESRPRRILYATTDRLGTISTNVSQAGTERYAAAGSMPRKRIIHMPNGIDLERFRLQPELRGPTREALGLGDEFVWLAVGRFVPPKDYMNLLGAFRLVRSSGSQAKLLIVGEGEQKVELKAFAETNLPPGAVGFLGKRTDVPELLASCDAYVMSSSSEGLPLVLLEAAGAGLPIVATDVGGNSEIVMDRRTGRLVPARNAALLSAAMLEVEALPTAERAGWGAAGREHVSRNFEIGAVAERWLDLYRQLVVSRRH